MDRARACAEIARDTSSRAHGGRIEEWFVDRDAASGPACPTSTASVSDADADHTATLSLSIAAKRSSGSAGTTRG